MSRLIVVEESQTVQRMVEIALRGLDLDLQPIRNLNELPANAEAELLVCAALGSWGDESALISQLNTRQISAPVVMLTPQGRAPEGFLGAQVVSALQKPFHTQTLVRAVCQALQREAPHEELFAPSSAIPLKRGGHSALSEPVMPASLAQAAPAMSSPKKDKELIPPPAQPPKPPPQMSFQTVVGVPIISEVPSPTTEAPAEGAAEAPAEGAAEAPAEGAAEVSAEAPASFEYSTSFGFIPDPQAPLPTLKGGSYQGPEGPSMEPSTSFGFSPSEAEVARFGPPPVFEEPPMAEAPIEAATQGEDELEDLDDSFSALDRPDIDLSPDWEPEDESEVELEAEAEGAPDQSAALNLERFAQSSSPVLNSTVKEVLKVAVLSLKEAGIAQATSDEALELFAQVAWEVIPELAEQIVRREVELALTGEGRS